MVVSRHPARALPHGFTPEVFDSARVQVAGVALAGTWVTLGVMYGFPCNAHHKQAKFQTESLLAELVERVGLQTVGPRAIGGDFNYGPEELEQVERLKGLGFREVQDLRAWRHGCSVEPTGRGTRRLDQLWLSPELQHACKMTRVEFDHWADHAAVSVSFSLDALSSVVHVWRVPQPFPWPAEWTCNVQVDFQSGMTESYAQFWNQVETQAKGWSQHQGVSVTRRQCGRASVLETTATRQFLAPVKKGREGDIQPHYLGTSLQHARFFRQLRRLQSLCRILAKGDLTWSGRFNRDDTWRAIRTAVGFPGGFGMWWTANGLQPAFTGPLPLLCPELDFAQGLFTGFQTFVRQYEQHLISQRYQFAKSRREKNLAHVFRDCKDDPLPQADTLFDRLEIGIEEVRSDDQSLVLPRPVSLLPDVPVVVGGVVVDVAAHSEDQIWVASVEGIHPGATLSQERAVLTDDAILARFAQVWQARWQKHHHVQPGQWDQICGFLDRTAPQIEWTCAPWTTDRFRQAVRHKKPRAAKGPDGVSQLDLCALPVSACDTFVDFYRQVEQGASWPAQMASGFVTSLAKHANASQVDEFRPVVVYSLAYRVWSSERAREALRSIVHLLPCSVQGGVPHRQAKSIWLELATVLESAYMNGEVIHGLLMDIQKCFNNIPRYPLWHALHRMGFPLTVLKAWVSFVSGQTRRFRVRRSVGEPIGSNCGLPEGCALSVFGMTMVDWMLDWWLQSLEVQVDLRTFVDDWGLLFRDGDVFGRLWTSLETFTGLLDLSLDMSKTRLWSNDGATRRVFRTSDLQVTLAARNLGAHQNFSRHCHNSVLQQRIAKMPQTWVRLRASPAPYRHKLAAIRMMAWPRALHGVTVVHVGEMHYKSLRAGAVRALKSDRKGANPYLHLANCAVVTDPEAWFILQTFRDTRELGTPDQVVASLGLFAAGDQSLPANGPTSVLLARIRRVGWAVGGQGLVQDQFGSFCLMHVAWDELVLRFQLSWGHVLAKELAHRATFDGLSRVDLPELHRVLRGFGPTDQVFLRCHLNGTLFTQNGRAHFRQGVTSKCPWCPAKDGFYHRAWVCPHFQACRAHITPDQWAILDSLPPCLRDHGWPVILSEWEVVAGMLLREDGLFKMSPVEPPISCVHQVVDLFMDGTSAHPTEARLRYAAWAVTIVPGGPGTLDNRWLMGGHVQGLVQTPFRAELTAALHAVRWAIQRGQRVRLWGDCQGVLRGLQRLLQGKQVRKNAPHSDLWSQMQVALASAGHLIQLRKVVSHGDIQQATGPLEEWAYWHNALTDMAADGINQRRTAEFWAAWEGLRGALTLPFTVSCTRQF